MARAAGEALFGIRADRDRARRHPRATDFRITGFRSDPASVFLRVGQKDLGVLSQLIRLMFQRMFAVPRETDRAEEGRFDVLFLLDEFTSLGKMRETGRAIPTVRASGAHLMRKGFGLGPEPERNSGGEADGVTGVTPSRAISPSWA
ncbi:type IV secretory system conjugative DNA transfer family protein [Amaricoccus sp.]|uniref:type IV secretory system conjugative DNA transfer family protein n=1 Tax=Amaricoccus sp. TaxID=1872485 RepID=UPI001B4B581D|nr:type IV secretory system conjugative DNA transfer family protein [Amaricoccus sp.]MBP7243195.1 type IV secretory system conjugative DNA transfer family protein [Amaricoccus sp.]